MLPSVLIVDDDEVDRYVLKRLLTRAGITDTIMECGDGQAALAFLQDRVAAMKAYPDKFPPILIFLDINMPRMNGFDFLDAYAKVRAQLGQEAVVLLMWTSSVLDADREVAGRYDFVKGWVQKMPDSADDLVDAVRRAVPS